MKRVRTFAAAAAAVLAVGGGAGVVAASAASAQVAAHPGQTSSRSSHGPHIVANPDSVMVNTSTTLHGSGFRPHHRLLLWECSARTWVVTMKVCNHRNAVHVDTTGNGRFTVKFKVLVCPVNSAVPAGFSRTCFIGVPKVQGVDTVTLIGAAKITVTGP